MKLIHGLLAFTFTCLLLVGCAPTDSSESSKGDRLDGPLSIYVVNYPLQYFAERIGGAHVEVTFPAPAEGDPAFWQPTADEIAAYQGADLILLNGADYAKWLAVASLPRQRSVNTSAAFEGKLISKEGEAAHAHGEGEAHVHGEIAFTTWLDPRLAIQQAHAVRDALVARVPAHAAEFEANCAQLKVDLDALDQAFAAATAGQQARPLLFSHPVYQYMERRYDLNGVSLHWEPDAVPPAAEWTGLTAIQGGHPATLMVWEGEPSSETEQRLQTLGIACVVVDPLGNRPESGDYVSNMRANADRLAAALEQ